MFFQVQKTREGPWVLRPWNPRQGYLLRISATENQRSWAVKSESLTSPTNNGHMASNGLALKARPSPRPSGFRTGFHAFRTFRRKWRRERQNAPMLHLLS